MGRRIESLADLDRVREAHGSVHTTGETGVGLAKPKAAAMVLNLPAKTVLKYMSAGLFVYDKKEKA